MSALDISELRCPASGLPLRQSETGLQSIDGKQTYPVVRGVPVLVSNSFSVFSPDDVAVDAYVEHSPPLWRRAVRKAIPSKVLLDGQRERFSRFVREVAKRSSRRRVLVVGGGTLGMGAEPLLDPRIQLVSTDVFLSPLTDIVCDGHHLPFNDGAFDGVVVQAVLEHVLDPTRVVAEIHRVLTPGGVVYAETPFMQQVHEGAYDFTRWTDSGHRRLFRMFTEIERGTVGGPGTSLLWAIIYFARSLTPGGNRATAAAHVATLLFFWLKYFDRLTRDNPGTFDAASGVFFLGVSADAPVSDEMILAGYRGAIGRPVRRA